MLSTICALVISLFSLSFSLFNFSVSRKDKHENQRRDIINNLMEIKLKCMGINSYLDDTERYANKIVNGNKISTEAERNQVDKISKEVDGIIAKIPTVKLKRNESHETLYIATKKLMVVVSHLNNSTMQNAERYQNLAGKHT